MRARAERGSHGTPSPSVPSRRPTGLHLVAVLLGSVAPLLCPAQLTPTEVTPDERRSDAGEALVNAAPRQTVDGPVIVASKPFAESYVLAEAFAQLLEARGIPVERRLGLASTEVIFQAVRAGVVDVYPEYTGTALTAVLDEEATGTAGQVFGRVSRGFQERWGIRWLPPLGFENTYAVAMRRAHADSLGISSLSELAAVAGEMEGGFSPDFIGRPDGLPGLAGAYDIDFRATRSLLQAVKYEALVRGEVDVIDGYSTDGASPDSTWPSWRTTAGSFPRTMPPRSCPVAWLKAGRRWYRS